MLRCSDFPEILGAFEVSTVDLDMYLNHAKKIKWKETPQMPQALSQDGGLQQGGPGMVFTWSADSDWPKS